jgi:hypothetical protein
MESTNTATMMGSFYLLRWLGNKPIRIKGTTTPLPILDMVKEKGVKMLPKVGVPFDISHKMWGYYHSYILEYEKSLVINENAWFKTYYDKAFSQAMKSMKEKYLNSKRDKLMKLIKARLDQDYQSEKNYQALLKLKVKIPS